MQDATPEIFEHGGLPGKMTGLTEFERPHSPYDRFMESEGVPIYRAAGVRRVHDLPLAPWRRLGGRGSYIQLYGTEGQWGAYVVEVGARDALIVEQHLYEELVFVVEGKGSTELWQRESGKHHRFEWQAGSLFAIPTNAFHRIVNESGSPALLLCATSAPKIIDLVDNIAFVFHCPYVFRQESFERADAFAPRFAIEADPIRARAMLQANFVPDLRTLELPLDNRRAPGYRRLELDMADSRFYQFAGEYESGRYSKAHRRRSTAAQICIGGAGYSYLWPSGLGPMPWRDGKSSAVVRQDYVYGGLIAPMRGGWFRQHFSTSVGPLRFLSWAGPNNHPALKSGRPGAPMKDIWALNLREGGNVVPYTMQDPAPAAEYREMLARAGHIPAMNGDPR